MLIIARKAVSLAHGNAPRHIEEEPRSKALPVAGVTQGQVRGVVQREISA